MSKQLYIILALILFIGCRNKSSEPNDVKTIEVSSKNTHKTSKLSDIITDCEFIPLETNNECLIGQIDKIEISNDNILTLDSRNAKNILRFSINGKFLNKISSLGRGPEEYSQVNDICLDPYSDDVGILTENNILIFDPSGKFVRKLDIPVYGYKIAWYDRKIVIYNGGKSDLYEADSESGKESNTYFKNVEVKQKVLNNPFQLLDKKQLLYLSNFDYTIYSITEKGILPHVKFVFDERMFTDNDIHLLKEDKKNANNFVRIKYYFESKTHIQIIYLFKKEPYLVVYNKNKNETNAYNMLGVRNDITYTSEIPFAMGVDSENNFFSSLDYNDVSDTISLKKKIGKYQGDLNSMSNPIILRFKYK